MDKQTHSAPSKMEQDVGTNGVSATKSGQAGQILDIVSSSSSLVAEMKTLLTKCELRLAESLEDNNV